jgi:hypothetical protein
MIVRMMDPGPRACDRVCLTSIKEQSMGFRRKGLAQIVFAATLCSIVFSGCSHRKSGRFERIAAAFDKCSTLGDGLCRDLDNTAAVDIHDYIESQNGLAKYGTDCFGCYFSAVTWFTLQQEYDKAGVCWARISYLLGDAMPPSEWVLAEYCATAGIPAREAAMVIYRASLSRVEGHLDAAAALNRSFDARVVPCLLNQSCNAKIVLSHEWMHRLQNYWFAVSDVDTPLFTVAEQR